ncbi:hypothetical protein Tco_0574203 [Tanacetum coccineum]
MHTTMVPEQVKTMKIQAGIQVSRPRELTRQLQLWKRFGRLYLIVFVLVSNIFPEVKGWLDEDLDNYHLKELRCSTQCHTQMSMWIISRGVVLLILLMLGISKDNEDPSWSTSFKTRRTQKTSSALEALWKTLFVLYLYLIGTLGKKPSELGSPGVVVYGYNGLPMHLVHPPSPDYVPLPLSIQEQAPLLAALLPSKTLSPGYIADSYPEENPEENPREYGGDIPVESHRIEEDYEAEGEEEHLASADSTAIASLVVDPVPSTEETEPFETDKFCKVDRLLDIPTLPPSSLTPLSSSLP